MQVLMYITNTISSAPTSGNTYAAFLANAKNSSLAGTFTPTASDVLSGSGVVGP